MSESVSSIIPGCKALYWVARIPSQQKTLDIKSYSEIVGK